jgi:hypothetical protein
MHNELRYQAKTHAISEKLSKERIKILHLIPIFFFLLKTNKQKKKKKKKNNNNNNNKDMLIEKEMTSNPSM